MANFYCHWIQKTSFRLLGIGTSKDFNVRKGRDAKKGIAWAPRLKRCLFNYFRNTYHLEGTLAGFDETKRVLKKQNSIGAHFRLGGFYLAKTFLIKTGTKKKRPP